MGDLQVIFRYYNETVQYGVKENGTIRGKPLLRSSFGFS